MSQHKSRQVTLHVEQLESRLTPDAASYVADLYRNVLERNGSPGEISAWVTLMNRGRTPAQVAQGFLNSHEHKVVEAVNAFQEVLHRLPDFATAEFYANALEQGFTTVNLRLTFFMSAEYQFTHPDNVSFVAGLYQDVLHRPPDATGLSGWASNLGFGLGRDRLTLIFLDSHERLGGVTDVYYQTFLGRNESAAERNFYINQGHLTGGAIEFMEAGFALSREYQIRHGV